MVWQLKPCVECPFTPLSLGKNATDSDIDNYEAPALSLWEIGRPVQQELIHGRPVRERSLYKEFQCTFSSLNHNTRRCQHLQTHREETLQWDQGEGRKDLITHRENIGQFCCYLRSRGGLLAPDLPSNWSSLRDLNCSHSNCQTWKARHCYLLSLPPCVRIG